MPGPTIPTATVIRECTERYERLLERADGRSIVVLPGQLFRRVDNPRNGTYWGYFRDQGVVVRIRPKTGIVREATLKRDVIFDDAWVRRARTKRTKHRGNVILEKERDKERDKVTEEDDPFA